MLDWKVHRVRDEAQAVRFVMELARPVEIRARRERDDRAQHDATKATAAVGLLHHHALGAIDVARDYEPRVGAEMQVPELVARTNGCHEKLFGIPVRGIATETRVG
jgi:hypothetical protein